MCSSENVREREFCKSCGKVKQLQQCNRYSSLEYTYLADVSFPFLHKALIIMFICYLCKLYSGTVKMYLCVPQCRSSLIYILYTVYEASLMHILFIYTIYKFIVIEYHSNKIIDHYQLTRIFIWYLICHSASNRNEYQVYFMGAQGGQCIRLTTLPPSCAVVMKSGKLNFLEPSGPLQACNGTALPSPYMSHCYCSP